MTCLGSHREESSVLCLEVWPEGITVESKMWGEGSVGKFFTQILELSFGDGCLQADPLCQVDQCGWEGAELKESSLLAEGASHVIQAGWLNTQPVW